MLIQPWRPPEFSSELIVIEGRNLAESRELLMVDC